MDAVLHRLLERRVLRNALIDQARRSSAAGRALVRYARELSGVEAPAEPRRVCTCTRKVLSSLKPEYAQRCVSTLER